MCKPIRSHVKRYNDSSVFLCLRSLHADNSDSKSTAVWGRRAWSLEGSQDAPGQKGDGGSGRLTREGGVHQ